jgi:hypothetical protein
MDFAEALELSKKFPIYRPKIFKGFVEWGIFDTETEGYVVFADTFSTKESGLNELEDYVKSHKLRIDHCTEHLMIYTAC